MRKYTLLIGQVQIQCFPFEKGIGGPTAFTVYLTVTTRDSGGGAYNHSSACRVTINYTNKTIAISSVSGSNSATGGSGSGSGSASSIVWS